MGLEARELINAEDLRVYARAKLPTEHGDFTVVAFAFGDNSIEDIALVRGDVYGKSNVSTRLHSECLTGDVFHSLRCDCRAQLERAQHHFGTLPEAIILYMRQEGRGIGLANKVAAYALQERGLDTVEANVHLGFDDDLRDYSLAAKMFLALGVKSLDLYTNNPRKIEGLTTNGIKVIHREPIIIESNVYNDRYLKTKRDKSGHWLDSKEHDSWQ